MAGQGYKYVVVCWVDEVDVMIDNYPIEGAEPCWITDGGHVVVARKYVRCVIRDVESCRVEADVLALEKRALDLQTDFRSTWIDEDVAGLAHSGTPSGARTRREPSNRALAGGEVTWPFRLVGEILVDGHLGSGTVEAIVVENHDTSRDEPWIEERAGVHDGSVDVDVDVYQAEVLMCERGRGRWKVSLMDVHTRAIAQVCCDVVDGDVAKVSFLVAWIFDRVCWWHAIKRVEQVDVLCDPVNGLRKQSPSAALVDANLRNGSW